MILQLLLFVDFHDDIGRQLDLTVSVTMMYHELDVLKLTEDLVPDGSPYIKQFVVVRLVTV